MAFDPSSAKPVGGFDPSSAKPLASAFPTGMVEPGTQNPFDYSKYPKVKNPDGSFSNVVTFSTNIDGKEVLLPSMVGGKRLTAQQAIEHYRKTGEHFGKFDSPEAAQAFADDVEKKMQGEAPPKDSLRKSDPMRTEKNAPAATALEQAEAFVEGAGRGALNLPGVVTTAIDKAAGSHLNEAYEARRQAIAEKAPLASGAGYLTGAAAGGGAVLRGVQAVPQAARVLAPVAGQTVRNALRYGASGAIPAAVQATAEGASPEEVAGAAALGGAVGLGVAGVARGADMAGQAVRSLTTDSGRMRSAMRVLGERIKESPERLEKAYNYFWRVTRREPTLLELTSARSGAELEKLAEHQAAIGNAVRQQGARAASTRPFTMQQQVKRGGPTASGAQIDAVRDAEFKKAINAKPSLMEMEFDLPTKTTVINGKPVTDLDLDPELAAAIAREVNTGKDKGLKASLFEQGKVTGQTLDNVRRVLNKRESSAPGYGFGKLANEVRDIVDGAVPGRYGKAIDDYAETSRFYEGFERGAANTPKGSLSGQPRKDADTLEAINGFTLGRRSDLADKAGAGVKEAQRLASTLSERADAAAVTGGLPPREARNLQRLGRAEAASAERFAQVTPKLSADSENSAQAAQLLIEGAAAAGGHVMRGFQVHWLRRAMLWAKDRAMAPATAREAAKLLTTPGRTMDAVRLLKETGKSDKWISEQIQAVAAASGAAAGGATQ